VSGVFVILLSCVRFVFYSIVLCPDCLLFYRFVSDLFVILLIGVPFVCSSIELCLVYLLFY